MANKRAAGTGSVYKERKNTWRAIVTIDGKRISHCERTQKEAESWARKMGNQIEQGLIFDATKKDLGTFLREWLEIKKTEVRVLTMQSYERMERLYITPYLGKELLRDINAAKIQAFYGILQAKKIGNRTIKIVHIVLYGCLQHARNLGLVSQNWCELVKAPKREKHSVNVWTEDQVGLFMTCYPDQTIYRMALTTGMRRGELVGLQWQDIDWKAETIRIQRQVIEPAGGGFIFADPKSDRGFRTIRLMTGMLEALRDQYNQVLPLARRLAGDRWQEYDLIFPTSIGTPRRGYEVSKEFKRLANEAGLPSIRLHDIRHTAASLMLLHGEPPVRVAAILGDSLTVLMDTYAHYIPDDQERAAEYMDRIATPTAVDLGVQLLHAITRKNSDDTREIDRKS
jgi:integrase